MRTRLFRLLARSLAPFFGGEDASSTGEPVDKRGSMMVVNMMLALALLAAPCIAHAQIQLRLPCSGSKALSEGRTMDIARDLKVNTVGMMVDDIEERYCVTPARCVALGFCEARSPAEQAAADKANPGAAAERTRLQREQQQRDAQAERQRQAAEAERNRKAAEVARETQRLGSHREAEARRLVEMREAAAKARGGVRPPGLVSSQPPATQDDAAAAARKRREALEAERAERERAEAEAKKKREEELRKHLAAERAGIRLRALKCGGQDTVVGTRPAVSPRIANCISVQYEARCPGVPQGQGIQMVFSNFVGGNSCFGDTQRLSRPLTCKPEAASVDVRSVTVCGW